MAQIHFIVSHAINLFGSFLWTVFIIWMNPVDNGEIFPGMNILAFERALVHLSRVNSTGSEVRHSFFSRLTKQLLSKLLHGEPWSS